MKRKQVKDYNYIRRKLAESGQLKDDKSSEERKKLEKDEHSLIDTEEGYTYKIDEERAGIVHKRATYTNRSELDILLRHYPEEEVYNYKLAKKQLKL